MGTANERIGQDYVDHLTKPPRMHTPGPWRKGPGIIIGQGHAVATYSGGRSVNYGSPDECEANARLIVQAPTLLTQRDRLLEAAETLLAWGDKHDPATWHVGSCGCALCNARETIAEVRNAS